MRPGRGDCSLAGVAAGALAVGQAFLAEQGDVRAGRTTQGLSLWEPHATDAGAGPAISSCAFPRAIWLVGLGNLGQAYLWSLMGLPYRQPKEVVLFFQDDDTVKSGNWGTSILAQRGRYGVLKTRASQRNGRGAGASRRAGWTVGWTRFCDGRSRNLRLFSPGSIGCRHGVCSAFRDLNTSSTPALERQPRTTAPSGSVPSVRARSPRNALTGVEDRGRETIEELLKLPAYRKIEGTPEHGQCGAATLAGQAVAVPFVSAIAGALVVAQAVRIASGEDYHSTLTADIADLRSVRAVAGTSPRRLAIQVDVP